MAEKGKTGFHYLGVGCLIAGIVGVLIAASLGFGAFRWARGIEASLKDPQSRERKVLDVLGAESLPDGYHPMLGVSIPFFMDMAMLTDREPTAEDEVPDLGERGLIYLSMRDFGGDRQELDDFFSGQSDDPEVLGEHNIDLELDERVAAGRLERSTGPVLWVSHRGEMISGRTRGRHRGLVTLLQIHCPGDDRNRLGIWFGPEPETPGVDESDALAGSIADAAAVRDFVAFFRFCPG